MSAPKLDSGLTITADLLKSWSACADGYQWFLKNYQQGATFGEINDALRADKRYSDSSWLVNRVFAAAVQDVSIVAASVKQMGADAAAIEKQVAETPVGETSASGYGSKLAASGNGSQLAASGYGSQLAASGNGSQLAASGNYSQLAASGNYSKLAASGSKSIVLGVYSCTASAGKDGAIALCWFDGKRPRIAVAYVGENGIKANTIYRVSDSGEFVEVTA
ncbi:MAG: hypothetical protein LW865_15795 [Betaproteobacteria bacterium]|nr:hypothetical protein [Betaproteobacteria bacterium]